MLETHWETIRYRYKETSLFIAIPDMLVTILYEQKVLPTQVNLSYSARGQNKLLLGRHNVLSILPSLLILISFLTSQ